MILHLLRLDKQVLESNTSVAQFEESQAERLKLRQQLANLEAETPISPYEDVRNGLSVHSWLMDHETALHSKCENPNAGKWILEDESHQHWKSIQEQASPILWAHGIPGAGKSVLASTMVHSQPYGDEVVSANQTHRLTEITSCKSSVKGHETKGQTNLPKSLDLRVPTDSGYASTTHDKAGMEQRTLATEDDAIAENQCSPGPIGETKAWDLGVVDSKTDYSNSSSLRAAMGEKYHSELVEALIDTVYSEPLDMPVVERICGVLPELLKAFALKLGHEEADQTCRNVMFFVHKHRSDIVECFRERFSQKAESVPGLSTSDSDKMPLEDIMALWDSHGDPEHDLEAGPSIQDLAEAAISECEEIDSEHETPELEPEEDFDSAKISMYQGVILNSAAYQWLVTYLRRELLLARAATDCMGIIRRNIDASLPKSNKVSRHRSTEAHRMTFRVLWEPMAFVREQEYTEAPDEVLERAITLTGTTCDAQALTCAQYLRQAWPSTGEHIIRLLKDMVRGRLGERCQCVLPDHTRLMAWFQDPEVIVEVIGPSCSIVEVGEQLAWLGAALRSSPHESGVALCTPFVREVCIGDSLSPVSNTLSATGLICTIAFNMRSGLEVRPPSNGQCWHNLFKNPVIVDGYPTRRRAEHNTGVEMPLNVMAELAGTQQLNTFNGRLFIKGYSAMLVPTRLVGDLLIWHLFFNKDGSRISYLHDTASHAENLMLSVVRSARHVLGWCSEAKYYAGAVDAVYTVGKSRLPRPHETCALENFSIYSGKLIIDGVAPCIGNKDSPIYIVRNGYVFKLHWISKKFVLLWDEEDKRGWLVNGTSVLLHLLRAYLEYSRGSNIRSAFLFKSEDMEEAAHPYSADSAIEVLLNTTNMDLRIYKEGSDYIRLKHQVEHYYDILEQLFDHQALQNSVCSGPRPRKDLEGWDFQDLATMRDPVHPRVTVLGTVGKGWVDFTRAIHTVNLFGRGFGDIIRPVADDLCAHWASLPKDKYYLAAYGPDLKGIMDLYDGDQMSIPMRLTEDILWHNPANDFVCQCAGRAVGDHSDVAQVLLPSTFAVDSLLCQSSAGWKGRGAVIFGQNMGFKWFWKDTGDPEEGEPGSSSAESDSQFHDSGVGQSLASSAPELESLALQHYTVGIVCALHKELLAVRELFDSRHIEPILPREDSNHYVLGRIGQHNVVTACLPSGEYGTNSAADIVTHMKRSFPNVKFYLLVGIGGGVPSIQNDIRLGDIVVSHPAKACPGVIQYDLVADLEQGRFERTGSLQRPSRFLMTALGILRSDSTTPTQLADYIKQIGDRNPTYRHPGRKRDQLIEASYVHDAGQRTCEQCLTHETQRKGRRWNHPKIHYGVVASGNRLIRNAQTRDQLGTQDNVLCVEMEAAGVVNTVDCLVIRGICDYADSHKNDTWQEYASATAAAYAKLFLSIVRPCCESENVSADSEPLLSRKRRASATQLRLSKRGTGDNIFPSKS
ncbi:hypothetical protein CLAIMM_08939 [Cladophialophora immunda]|nr:hypothetical protein CLAIMM_08939 [Cladophialophora immunda]